MTLSLPTLSPTTATQLQQSACVFNNPRWSVLKASGSGIREYLQGQITQDISQINAQQAIHSCILSPQGKAVSELYIIAGHSDELVILTPSTHAVATVARLRQFAIGQSLRIGVVDSIVVATVHGTNAMDVLNDFGLTETTPEWLACSSQKGEDSFALTLQNNPQVYFLISSQARINQLTQDQSNIDHMKTELEALRILQGKPVFGAEWDERLHPLNANLIEFNGVDFKKGCYVGQEVTSRMHWRGGIKKKLYRVKIDGRPVELPCPIHSSVNVGELKSAAIDAQNNCFGIALLPIEIAESKPTLTLENNNNNTVTILEACHA